LNSLISHIATLAARSQVADSFDCGYEQCQKIVLEEVEKIIAAREGLACAAARVAHANDSAKFRAGYDGWLGWTAARRLLGDSIAAAAKRGVEPACMLVTSLRKGASTTQQA
jgi:hypothetical protein